MKFSFVSAFLLFSSLAFASPLTVSLSSPPSGTVQASPIVSFSFTPDEANPCCSFWGAWLYFTNTTLLSPGLAAIPWAANASNSSPISDASANTISATLPDGSFVWNVNASTNDSSAFAASNYTLTVDSVPPGYFSSSAPANNSNATGGFSVAFTPGDGLSGVSSTTVFAIHSNGSAMARAANASVSNGTAVTTGFASLPAGTYNLVHQLCDWAGNCANYSGIFITVAELPSVGLASPASGSSTSINSTIVFTITVSNAVNFTLFTNSTGSWAATATNTSLSGGSTHTLNITNIPSESLIIWNARACTAQGCAFAPGNYSLILDSKAPRIEYIAQTPADSSILPTTTLIINVSITDPFISIVTLELNGVNYTSELLNIPAGSPYYTTNKTIATTGSATFAVFVTDSAGNMNATARRTVYGPLSGGSPSTTPAPTSAAPTATPRPSTTPIPATSPTATPAASASASPQAPDGKPGYDSAKSAVEALLSQAKAEGVSTAEAESLISVASNLAASGDYTAATAKLEEARVLLKQATASSTPLPQSGGFPIDPLVLLGLVIVIIIAIIGVYFYKKKSEYHYDD